MNEKAINEKIRTAVRHSVPDVLDSVLANLDKQKGDGNPMHTTQVTLTKKRSWMKPYGMIAAMFAMLVVGFASYNFYEQRAVDSVISLDVNPSIEMKVNNNEKVLAVQPLNEDGQIIVGGMDFKNTDLEIAVNALIGSMLKNGYISEIKNSILISVENKDEAKGAALQAKLAEEIDRLLQAGSINGAIVSQSVTVDDQLKTLADEHTITSGKAQVVKQLVDMDPRYRFEELAKLSINELNLLVESKHVELANASTVGTVSDKAYFGKENAVKTAMNHAGVKASAAKDLEVELDYDDGKMVYEVEFYAGGKEYEYEIDAVSGAILSSEVENDDDDDDKGGNNVKPAVPAPSNNAGPTTTPKTEQPTKTPSQTEQTATSSRMSAADARKAVLAKFGGIIQKIEYNYDDKKKTRSANRSQK